MKLYNLVGSLILIIMLSGCSDDASVTGDYICSRVKNTGNIEIMNLLIREDGKGSLTYKGVNNKASWNGNSEKINIFANIYEKDVQISLLSTGKFDINSEVYSMVIEGQTFEDVCLKILK